MSRAPSPVKQTHPNIAGDLSDNLLSYARLLDAGEADASWEEAALVILGCDANIDAGAAKACWASHLERARWLVSEGFTQMLGRET